MKINSISLDGSQINQFFYQYYWKILDNLYIIKLENDKIIKVNLFFIKKCVYFIISRQRPVGCMV